MQAASPRSAGIRNPQQTRKSGDAITTSALPTTSDIPESGCDVRKVPARRLMHRSNDHCYLVPLVGVGDLQSENIATAVLSRWVALPQSLADALNLNLPSWPCADPRACGRDLPAASTAVAGGRFPTGTGLQTRPWSKTNMVPGMALRGMRLMAKGPARPKG